MREHLAWAGGLFEGEGSFSLQGGRYPTAQLAMTDADTVVTFAEIVGVGRTYGPYQSRSPAGRPLYSWQATNFQHVQALIAMLWPWLGGRRRQRARELLLAAKR